MNDCPILSTQDLLEAGAVVNSIASTSQSTALILASQGDNARVIELLLSKGANVDASNGYGNTALHEATRHGHVDVVEVLLSGGASVNKQNKKGMAALLIALILSMYFQLKPIAFIVGLI